MGLFSSPVAEINIDFYGQKRRNKAVSNVQVYFKVTMSPYKLDPIYLGDLYSKALIACSDIVFIPWDREFFWKYMNESLANVIINPNSIFSIAPGFIDVAPIMSQPVGKINTFIKVSLMDNGKMKWKMSENGVAIYYNTLAPIAMMQFFISILSQDQFAVFYETVRNRMDEKIRVNDKSSTKSFDLEPLPVFNSVQPQQSAPIQQAVQKKKFCSGCGSEIVIVNGVFSKFCGGCGKAVV